MSRPSAAKQLCEIAGSHVSPDELDQNGLFLNEKYKEFVKIYSNDADYTVYDAASICKDGISIPHR
jgi:hypothetical protein